MIWKRLHIGRNSLVICATLGLALVILFSPLLYSYKQMELNGRSTPMRVHLVTGKTEVLEDLRWVKVEGTGLDFGKWLKWEPKPVAFSSDDRAKVTGTARLSPVFGFRAVLYNGTRAWVVKDVIVRITVRDKPSTESKIEWSREFKSSGNWIPPLDSRAVEISVPDVPYQASSIYENLPNEQWTWEITEIAGNQQ